VLLQCSLKSCSGGDLCPGFVGGTASLTQSNFAQSCPTACNSDPQLISQIDPCDCETTVDNAKALLSEYNTACVVGCSVLGGPGGGTRNGGTRGAGLLALLGLALYQRTRSSRRRRRR
jgi:hypothetical protein